MPSGKQKEITVLKKLIEADGYIVKPAGSGHWKVFDKNGTGITDEHGALILSGTSSDVRGRAMAVNRLMKAGVLKRDPWAPQKGKDASEENGDGPDAAEIARLEREAEARRTADQGRSERTRKIRERLEPVVVRLGGWEKRGMLAEIGLVAHYVASRLEFEDAWPDAKAAQENADALRKGATLSQAVAPLWEALLTDLEEYPDIKIRWFQLVKEAKGLADPTLGETTRSSPSLQLAPPPSAIEERSNADPDIPTLALRVMFEMAVGRTAQDPDRKHVEQLGLEVARLEMKVKRGEAPSDPG